MLLDPLLTLQFSFTLKLPLLYQYFTCTTHGTDIFSFPLRWNITWYCCCTTVVIHWSCTPLIFDRIFLSGFRIEVWLALQILYNIFQKCLGNYVTGQGKFMPSTAMHTFVFDKHNPLYVSSLQVLRIHYKEGAPVDWGLELCSLCKAWRDIFVFILRWMFMQTTT